MIHLIFVNQQEKCNITDKNISVSVKVAWCTENPENDQVYIYYYFHRGAIYAHHIQFWHLICSHKVTEKQQLNYPVSNSTLIYL